jgi:hypothetical protein
LWRVGEFVAEGGRGAFKDALTYVDRETPGSETQVVLAGDHDFRVPKFVAFYERYAGTRPVVYKCAPPTPAAGMALGPASAANAMPPDGVPWLLVHRPDGGAAPDETVKDAYGNKYLQASAFRAAPFGGWDWYVYRRVE